MQNRLKRLCAAALTAVLMMTSVYIHLHHSDMHS